MTKYTSMLASSANIRPTSSEILDVALPQRKSVTVEHNGAIASDYVDAIFQHGKLSVTNRSDQMLLLQSLSTGEEEESINVLIGGGERVELKPDGDSQRRGLNSAPSAGGHDRAAHALPGAPSRRVLSRRSAALHHLRPWHRKAARRIQGTDIQERRLRRVPQRTLCAVLAMANLGALLMQQQSTRRPSNCWTGVDDAQFAAGQRPAHASCCWSSNRRRAKTGQTAAGTAYF